MAQDNQQNFMQRVMGINPPAQAPAPEAPQQSLLHRAMGWPRPTAEAPAAEQPRFNPLMAAFGRQPEATAGVTVPRPVPNAAVDAMNRQRSEVPQFAEGGRVGPGGIAFRPDGTVDSPLNTTSMDLPPSIAQLLGTGDMPGPGLPQAIPQGMPMHSYAAGGQVGPGGVPMPQQPAPGQPPMPMPGGQPGVAEPGQMTPEQQRLLSADTLEAEAARVVREHPEAVQQMQQGLQQAIQQGQMTEEQLMMSVQMARVALENPEMYPQLRQIAIQKGIASEQELSPEFDPGYLFLIVLAGEALVGPQQAGLDAGGAPGMAPGGQPPIPGAPSMERGGALPQRSPSPDGAIPINAHEGEYVVPANVVRAKGTEFFDKMVSQYQGGGERK